MIITKRDKMILKFIEDNGAITINQASKIFFRDCKRNYYQARKRLKLLSDNGVIRRYRKDMRSETVYYFTKIKSIHDIKIMDVYAELVYLGADVKAFEKEFTITCGKKSYRADALIECIYNRFWYCFLLEVDYSHMTSDKKLECIYNSNFFQERYASMDEEVFPVILITRPFIDKTEARDDDCEYVVQHLKWDLNNLKSIFK